MNKTLQISEEPENLIPFNLLLRRIRKNKNLSTRALSTKAGLSPSTVSKIENGRIPTKETVQALRKALHPLSISDDLILHSFCVAEELRSASNRYKELRHTRSNSF